MKESDRNTPGSGFHTTESMSGLASAARRLGRRPETDHGGDQTGHGLARFPKQATKSEQLQLQGKNKGQPKKKP
jgi:hypothetical protein